MEAIFVYLLKACIYSGILFLYYIVALRNKQFHYYNRFYLLMSVALSLILPFVNMEVWQWQSGNKQVVQLMNVMLIYDGNAAAKQNGWSFSPAFFSLLVAIFVAVCLLAILTAGILKILRFRRRYPSQKIDNIIVINTDLEQAPFSFFKNLFWKNTLDFTSTTGKQILKHEMTHIQQKHSWDKVFMRIITSLFWLNPFYWLMQKELSMIHEFIADEKAIEDKNAEAFALMLLQAQYSKMIFSPAQSFHYSPIKRRLFMLTTSKKPSFSYARRILILPLLAATVLLFAFKLQKEPVLNENLNRLQQQNTVNEVADEQQTTTDTTNKPAPLYLVDGKETSPEEAKKIDGNKIESIHVFKDTAATKKYGEKGKNGVIEIKMKKSSASSQDSFTQDLIDRGITIKASKSDSSLIVVDGVIMPNRNELDMLLQPDNNFSMTVIKGEPALKKYGEKGRYGVVEITTEVKAKGKQLMVSFSPPKIVKDTVEDVELRDTTPKEKYEKVFTTTQTAPSFPGGNEAWREYLQQNLRVNIPTEHKAPTGKYTVIVSFLIDEEGNLSDIKATNNPGFGTASEAVRVIQRGPKWIPAQQEGKKVLYRQKQSITFEVKES